MTTPPTSTPTAGTVQAALVDLNGIFRGKRLPVDQVSKVVGSGLRMPISVLGVDVWGRDLVEGEFVFATGDLDGICQSTGRGPLDLSWRQRQDQLVPLWAFNEDGTPLASDPRHCLAEITKRFHLAGLKPVVATELEFYLVDPTDHSAAPPRSLVTGDRSATENILSLSELDQFNPFFDAVFDACHAWGIKAETATSEAGGGQFEINIAHSDDPLKAADDAVLFKFLVRDIARQQGMAATFMAKPFAEQSGNGLHIHMSILDQNGQNMFDDGSPTGSTQLAHAVGGVLAAMPGSTLLFAPHLNSYRRLRPGAHAPTAAAWGIENRTTAVRIPGGPTTARRFEHRVAGADANPYLVLAAVMGAALHGIENDLVPPPAVDGNAYAASLTPLPTDWRDAIDSFAAAATLHSILPDLLRKMYVAGKRQEMARWASEISALDYQTYLETV